MIEAPPSSKPSAQPRVVSGHSSPMIAVRSLAKKIGQQEILRGVDLEVATGETLAIIGRSGGGKSVLLKHLVGLMTPDAGEICIDGQNIIGMNERQLGAIRKKVGILFQGGALFDSMTVEENIAFPLREAGERDPRALRSKVWEMLEVMEMEGQEDKMPESLSGGMKKRVGLARSIIRRPSCVLYDEPTSGLDPVVADSINRLIRRLQQRFGMTSVVVTHDMKSAFDVADRIAYLHEGRIYFNGTANQLQRSTDPIIQDFLLGRSDGGGDGVAVPLKIYDYIKIPEGTKFTVGSTGLLGDRFVNVTMPPGPPKAYLPPNADVNGARETGIDDLTRSGGALVNDLRGTVQKIDTTVDRLNQDTLSPANMENLKSSMEHLNQATGALAQSSQKLDGVV